MGRLSEYINGYRGRHSVYGMTSPRYNTRTGSLNKGGDNGAPVQVFGVEANLEVFEHMLTYEPNFDRHVRKLIKELLKEARKNIVKDLGEHLKNDPRKAYRAVKHVVYKQLFGGNVSILKKRKAGAKYKLIRQRKLQPGQRGGNRWPRIESRNRLDQYYGSDRGFILRFLSSGTVDRETHYGNRKHIQRSDLFGHIAPWHMQQAANDLVDNINEYIKRVANG